MTGVVLDTHALYWLVSGNEELSEAAPVAIGNAQEAGNLFVSPITARELALAVRKPQGAPQLGDNSVERWFRIAVRELSAKVVPIGPKIALEAANMVSHTGHKDPGDCYIVATARAKKLAVITRDAAMHAIAVTGYISVVTC